MSLKRLKINQHKKILSTWRRKIMQVTAA